MSPVNSKNHLLSQCRTTVRSLNFIFWNQVVWIRQSFRSWHEVANGSPQTLISTLCLRWWVSACEGQRVVKEPESVEGILTSKYCLEPIKDPRTWKKLWGFKSLYNMVYITMTCLLSAVYITFTSISRGTRSIWDEENERKWKKLSLCKLQCNEFSSLLRGFSTGTRIVRNHTLNVSFYLLLSSFTLQFSLIVESLCLPCTHALFSNDANRVKCFQGPTGKKTPNDFWRMDNQCWDVQRGKYSCVPHLSAAFISLCRTYVKHRSQRYPCIFT